MFVLEHVTRTTISSAGEQHERDPQLVREASPGRGDSAATDALCPSAQPEMVDCRVIGIVHGNAPKQYVDLLAVAAESRPLLDLIPKEIRPTEVLRFAAPCAEDACIHFADGACNLAKNIVTTLPHGPVDLKHCSIRPSCRWWRQEGVEACRRCSLVITEPFAPTEALRSLGHRVS
jgi:hypothetical protein